MARVFLLQAKERLDSPLAVKCLLFLYGIWNLDFFRSFDLGICLGIGTLATLALDIAVGICILSYYICMTETSCPWLSYGDHLRVSFVEIGT